MSEAKKRISYHLYNLTAIFFIIIIVYSLIKIVQLKSQEDYSMEDDDLAVLHSINLDINP